MQMPYQLQTMQNTTIPSSQATPLALINVEMNCSQFQGSQKHKTQENYDKDTAKYQPEAVQKLTRHVPQRRAKWTI